MIKRAFTLLEQNRKEYMKHWYQYLILTMVSSIFSISIGIYICGKFASAILSYFGVSYISSATILTILKQPLCILLLLIALSLLVLFVYFQYVVMLNGIRDIHNEQFSFLNVIKYSAGQFFDLRLRDIPPIVFYVVVILPLSGIGYTATVFNKVTLPTFIVDACLKNPILTIALIALGILFIYLGLKFFYVLPLNVLGHRTIKDAYKESSERMKKKKISMLFFLLIMAIYLLFIDLVLFGTGYLLQLAADTFFPQINKYTLYVIASVLQILYLYVKARYLVITMLAIVPEETLKEDPTVPKPVIKISNKIITRIALFAVIGVYCVAVVGISLYTFLHFEPEIISHRGVDGENGVQNTIPALIATIESSHPDYIEIDIQETKDLQFVVLHDSSPYALTGDEGSTHDYTLEQLTKMVAKENGFSANLCSFDDYLDEAEKRGQKLLIEIKPHSGDSPDMLKRFVEQYGERIIENGHMVQSMNLNVVESLCGSERMGQSTEGMKVNGETIPVSCIIEYNIIYPETKAKVYTMEETTIDDNIMSEALVRGDKIYAWTINSVDSMRSMIIQNVNGIITDYPSMMREEVEKLHNGKYAEVLYLYMKTLYD